MCTEYMTERYETSTTFEELSPETVATLIEKSFEYSQADVDLQNNLLFLVAIYYGPQNHIKFSKSQQERIKTILLEKLIGVDPRTGEKILKRAVAGLHSPISGEQVQQELDIKLSMYINCVCSETPKQEISDLLEDIHEETWKRDKYFIEREDGRTRKTQSRSTEVPTQDPFFSYAVHFLVEDGNRATDPAFNNIFTRIRTDIASGKLDPTPNRDVICTVLSRYCEKHETERGAVIRDFNDLYGANFCSETN